MAETSGRSAEFTRETATSDAFPGEPVQNPQIPVYSTSRHGLGGGFGATEGPRSHTRPPVSQASMDVVRAAFEEVGRLMATSTEDLAQSLEEDYARLADRFLHPDFELVPADSAVERRTLRGPGGFVTFLEGGRETWREARLEAEKFVDLGD